MDNCVIWYAAFLLGFIIPLQIICATQLGAPKMKQNTLLYSSEFIFTDFDDWKLFDYIWKISVLINILIVIVIVAYLYNNPPKVVNMYYDSQGNIYNSIPDGYYVEPDIHFDIID